VDTCGNVSKEKGDAISFWPMNNTYWIFEKQYLSVSRPPFVSSLPTRLTRKSPEGVKRKEPRPNVEALKLSAS
jgi:hypothetical protein